MYEMERDLLRNAGHEVVCYERRNNDIQHSALGALRIAAETAWSHRTFVELSSLLERVRPDVAHFHNTSPLISASAYQACKNVGVPVIQTLHNYRLVCPGALLLRDGKPCEQCIGRIATSGVLHACYRNSRSASAVVAIANAYHHQSGAYKRNVDRYIALTQFARERFIRGGLPSNRIVVRPNFLSDSPPLGAGDGDYALFVGRLTAEKGVHTLINAWQTLSMPLKVVGDGALRADLESQCRRSNANVDFLGLQVRSEVLRLMRGAALLVVPSICYEGFPVTLLEAFASGVPIVASALGALDELVVEGVNGMKFEAGNVLELRGAVTRMMDCTQARSAMRVNNRSRYEADYSPTLAVQSLEHIYASVVARDAAPCRNPMSAPAPHVGEMPAS